MIGLLQINAVRFRVHEPRAGMIEGFPIFHPEKIFQFPIEKNKIAEDGILIFNKDFKDCPI